jgi:hypothetical protein
MGGELLGEGEHIRIHDNVTVLLLLLQGQVRVNTEVVVILLLCHLTRHREVFELLLLLLGVASDFLFPILLDNSKVILDLSDVIDDPTSTIFTSSKPVGIILGC